MNIVDIDGNETDFVLMLDGMHLENERNNDGSVRYEPFATVNCFTKVLDICQLVIVRFRFVLEKIESDEELQFHNVTRNELSIYIEDMKWRKLLHL